MTPGKLHVSILAVPYSALSSVSGFYDVLKSFEIFGEFYPSAPRIPPFEVEVVGLQADPMPTVGGLELTAQRSIADVEQTDIVIVPSVSMEGAVPRCGGDPRILRWLRRMHAKGAMLCSACSGVFFLAQTGLLDGLEATIHWSYASAFQKAFPKIRFRLGEALVVAGKHKEFVMAGGSGTWHDLVLYLIARHVGPTTAQEVANYMLLNWHADGQAPYVAFAPPMNHGDAVVLRVQEWLAENYAVACPVEEMVRLSALPDRSFKRRFRRATGSTPIDYVQHLRVQEAKRRLERTTSPVDEISWAVGYEDPAFFRRLFKRITRLTPGEYRRKFRLPEYTAVRPGAAARPGERPSAGPA